MRAREPDSDGFVERDGVKLAYEVFGDEPGGRPSLLVPTWQIVHSRFWKAQVPYLARHFRVVTFDGRGSGRSARPAGAAAYTDLEFAADVAGGARRHRYRPGRPRRPLVRCDLGAAGRGRPSRAGAGHRRHRAPSCWLDVAYPSATAYAWDGGYDTTEGWAKYNRHYWLEGGYDDFLEFFFGEMFPEPHSTKQIEDLRRLGARDRTADAGRRHRRPAQVRRRRCASIEEACQRVSAARCWSSMATTTSIRPHARRRGPGRAHGRLARDAWPAAGTGPRPRPRARSTG